MRSLFIGALSACIAFAPAQAQQSIAGEWDAGVGTPGGVRVSRVIFEVKGDTVTGVVKRPTGDVKLTGTLKGNTLTYSYVIEYNGNPFTMTVTATVTGDTMKGRVDLGGQADDEFSATRVVKK